MKRAYFVATLVGLWFSFGIALSLQTFGNGTSSGRVVIGTAGVVGVVTAVAGLVAVLRTHQRGAGVCLLVSGIAMPTSFAYPLNLLVVALGIALLFGKPQLGPA